jgi:hypothetical protein
MCDIEKIEKEIDVEMNIITDDYLNISFQGDPEELRNDLATAIEIEDYNLKEKTTDRFLGEI